MKIQEKPDYLIFAQDSKSGELLDFPDVPRGWGVTIEQTGSKPPMEWMNGAFNRIDKNVLYLLQQGVPEWNEKVTYPVNAIIKYNGVLYTAIVKNENSIPTSSATKWKKTQAEIPDASTTQNGIVKLSSATNSTAENQAATPLAVKNTYDLAASSNHKIDDLKQFFSYSDEHHQAEVHSLNQINHLVVRDDDLVGLYSSREKDFLWLFSGDRLHKGFIDVSQVLTQQRHEENGFVKLPSGIILQWLTSVTDNWGALDVTLPIAFPSKLLSVFITEASAQNWTDDALYSYGYSSQYSNQSTIRVHSRCAVKTGEVVRRSGRFSLLAIGY